MLFLAPAMFVLLSTLLAAPTPPPVISTTEILLDGVTAGHTSALSDGHTVTFLISPTPADLTTLLDQQLDADTEARLTSLPERATEIELHIPHPVIGSRVLTSSSGARLVVEFEHRTDAIRRRALSPIPRSVPSVFVGPRVRAADVALAAGRFEEARLRFSGMTHEYSLRSWAELRLADLDLVAGETDKACAGYRGVAAEFPQRTAGLVARMRLHGLECVQKETVTIDWSSLVSRLRHAEGPVGRFMLREAAWVLHVTRDPDLVRSALAAARPTATRSKLKAPAQLRHALLARAVRHRADPFRVARACFGFRRAIVGHPEGRSLLLACARATIALDLPDTAVTFLNELERSRAKGASAKHWRDSRGDLQRLRLLADAYAAGGRTYLSRRAADEYATLAGEPPPTTLTESPVGLDTDIARTVNALEGRVAALRAHLEEAP